MNLLDLYEMRDPRDAYQRDVDNSRVGMNRQSRADVTGEEEPSGVFTVVIDGKPWKTGSSNEMFALAGRIANKHTDKKVSVKWPTGELNTVRPQGMAEDSSENKYSNLSNRGVNRGINRAGDNFNRMLDLDQVESPHYKTQHQQDTKQRLKTKPMAGPKGTLPEQGVAEDIGDLGYNVVRYYEKTQEVKKLTNWLEKEAGLPRNSPLYFDDVDLVYGNKTIVPGALINPKLTFNDLLTAVVQASKQGMAEATGDEKFDTMMGQIQKEPKYPDSQMPPTDVKDLYQWAVENNKLYHEIFAEWANREGYKSVAPALQRAGDLDTEALDYWTPRVWKIYWGEVRGIDSEMPPEWAKKRVPDELRDYLETVFDAYNRIVFDWPTEYRQIGQQGVAEGDVDSDGYSMDHADSGEYDYEGDQARDQMNTIVRAARRLDGLLDDNENMPEWVQMKVTLAADYLDTAADYIESNQEPELEEGERGSGVDAKGRTQQQWIRLVKAKYPDARIMQSKMIDGPCQAILSDGRKLSWIKVDNQSTEIDEASWNPTTGGDYPVDYTGREMVTGPSDQKWQAAIDYYNDDIGVRRALQDLANKNSRLAPRQYVVATFANRANRDETRYFKSKSEAYEYARITGQKLTSIEKLDNDEVTPPVTYNVILGVKEHRRMFKLTFASDEVAQKWEHDNKDVVKIQWNDERGQYSPPTTPRAPDTYGGKIPGDETGQVNEKSVSQVQFRTMAAAAHNPEFAKKVGISQDVAQEFHGADRKQEYKKLPDRTTEGEQQKGADYRDPPEADYGDDYQDMVARVKKLAGLGPLKTVWDPTKRVYRNVPVAVQTKK